jgi:hypothetical protein
MNHPGVLGYPILTHTNGISQGMRISLQEIKGVPSKKTNHWCEVSGVKSFFFVFNMRMFFSKKYDTLFHSTGHGFGPGKKNHWKNFQVYIWWMI